MKNKRLIFLVTGLVTLIAAFCFPALNGETLPGEASDWSNFGQYIGGIFSVFAFGALIWSIIDQQITHNNSEKEKRRNSVEDRIIKKIEFHHKCADKVQVVLSSTKNISISGVHAFHDLNRRLDSYYLNNKRTHQNIGEKELIGFSFTMLYRDHGAFFGFYFRNLFYLIKYIETSCDQNKDIDVNYYIKLVRAQLSTPEIRLLMYNCLFEKGKPFKELVEKYGLLNGIDDHEMIAPIHRQEFSGGAFK